MARKKYFGKCRICLDEGRLTADHVPSQSCGNTGKQYYSFYYFDEQVRQVKHNTVQNGVKFNTICDHCNNVLLGGQLEPALAKFTQQVLRNLSVSQTLKLSKFNYQIEINKICRCVCAKFLSMNKNLDIGFFGNKLRQYILNQTQPKIEGCHLYLRFYPYPDKIFYARNMMPMGGYYSGVTSCLYYYPFAFMLFTKVEDDTKTFHAMERNVYHNMVDLFDYTTNNINEIINYSFDLSSAIDQYRHEPYNYNFPLDYFGMLLEIKGISMHAQSKKI